MELALSENIKDVMQKNVIVANVDDTVSEVETFIAKHQLSFIPVVDNEGQCFGVITEFDMVKFHRDERNTKLVKAWEICSHSLIQVDSTVTCKEAASKLINEKIHHLLIVTDDVICGVVSSIDLLRHYVGQENG